jgi:hypothetical protein
MKYVCLRLRANEGSSEMCSLIRVKRERDEAVLFVSNSDDQTRKRG